MTQNVHYYVKLCPKSILTYAFIIVSSLGQRIV
jgi:hypothetical protein